MVSMEAAQRTSAHNYQIIMNGTFYSYQVVVDAIDLYFLLKYIQETVILIIPMMPRIKLMFQKIIEPVLILG